MIPQSANRLIHENSPYLLQHAHNPVDWFPWGDEALERARRENKLILVSIGYSACHWCHVMERESFEDPAVADLMNNSFINIKIDREERPDLDHIYMDAVQLMTGSGGWPLNVFLTPEAKPFYGGTYFPPVRAYNRVSWTEVLKQISLAWVNRREEINEQAEQLTRHLSGSARVFKKPAFVNVQEIFTPAQASKAFSNLMKTADTGWGGFSQAPKFPQTFSIRFLLQYHHFTANEEALSQALLSLDKMLEGGIYDQVGGGLARYSTDKEWLAPHFEKMLYDNALLVMALSDAFSLTRLPRYETAIRKTLGFIIREMQDPEGGFYAAIDADSEGEEGRFYVWSRQEVDEILKADSALFCRFFNITEKGNWEGKNILRRLEPVTAICEAFNLEEGELEKMMDRGLEKLLKARNERVRPGLDDKQILGWNALMITAFCRASAVLDDDHLRVTAVTNFNNILSRFRLRKNEPEMGHTFKEGKVKYPAFLDDYALLIEACINLQEVTSDFKYLDTAMAFTEHVIDEFYDPESGYFFYTTEDQQDLIVRKMEYHDGAMPSGNSLMAGNLLYLATLFNEVKWQQMGQEMAAGLSSRATTHPGSFGLWAMLIMQQAFGAGQIVVTGNEFEKVRGEILKHFHPGNSLLCASKPHKGSSLFEGKKTGAGSWIYWCINNSCRNPVETPADLFLMIRSGSV